MKVKAKYVLTYRIKKIKIFIFKQAIYVTLLSINKLIQLKSIKDKEHYLWILKNEKFHWKLKQPCNFLF